MWLSSCWIGVEAEPLEGIVEQRLAHEDRDLTVFHPVIELNYPLLVRAECWVGVLVRLCRAVLGDGWSPRQVCLTSPAPAGSELAPFRRLLRCDLQFDAEFNALIFPASDLDRTGVLADPGMAAHARSLLDAAGRGAERSTREQVEWSIQLLLPVGRATIQSCAASLGLTVRTLQRRLDQEGAVFSDLLNAARKQLCVQYLGNPRLRIVPRQHLCPRFEVVI